MVWVERDNICAKSEIFFDQGAQSLQKNNGGKRTLSHVPTGLTPPAGPEVETRGHGSRRHLPGQVCRRKTPRLRSMRDSEGRRAGGPAAPAALAKV